MRNKKSYIGLFLSLLFILYGTFILSVSSVTPRLSELRAVPSDKMAADLARCLESCKSSTRGKGIKGYKRFSHYGSGLHDRPDFYGNETANLDLVTSYKNCRQQCQFSVAGSSPQTTKPSNLTH